MKRFPLAAMLTTSSAFAMDTDTHNDFDGDGHSDLLWRNGACASSFAGKSRIAPAQPAWEIIAMKHSFPAIALLLAVAALPAHAQTRMKIVAGPVKATGDTISGSFRVQESRGAGIVSNGTGGACLVAERSDHACGTDDDCGDLRTHYHPAGWAYCLDPPGVHRHKTCWVRPGADVDFCLKSPVAPLPLDTHIDLPQVDPRVVGSGHAIRWRVIACLNGYDAATKAGNRACGGHPTGTNPELMTSNGPARRVP